MAQFETASSAEVDGLRIRDTSLLQVEKAALSCTRAQSLILLSMARSEMTSSLEAWKRHGIQIYDESEGFSFQQFGGHEKIRSLWLALPNLERQENSLTASPQQIIACIRAFQTPLIPCGKPDYFARVKILTKTEKLIITKVTPFYGEGIYGEHPTNDEPPKIVTPIAELEAVADFGNSNMPIRLFSPITVSEVARLALPNSK